MAKKPELSIRSKWIRTSASVDPNVLSRTIVEQAFEPKTAQNETEEDSDDFVEDLKEMYAVISSSRTLG